VRLLGTVIGAIVVFFLLIMTVVRGTLSSDLNALAGKQVAAGADAFATSVTSRADQTRFALGQIAAQENLRSALRRSDRASVKEILQGMQQPNGLSWVTAIDAHGKVIARANGLDAGTVAAPMVNAALRGRIVSGLTVLNAPDLAAEFLTQDAAPLSVVPAVAASVPVNDEGKTIAAIYGGTMLAGDSKLIDTVSHLTGGKAAFLIGNRIAASSLENADGSPVVNVTVAARPGYAGSDRENGTTYFVNVQPVSAFDGAPLGALWFGVPIEAMTTIANHATAVIALLGILTLAVVVALLVLVVNRIAKNIAERSTEVRESARALGILVVGSEVSSDHVAQARKRLETVEALIDRVVPTNNFGNEGSRLRTLTREANDDIVVIDTLSTELEQRMRDAEHRVTELNDTAGKLDRLVRGAQHSAQSP